MKVVPLAKAVADNADERPSGRAVQMKVRLACLLLALGKAGGPTGAFSRRPCWGDRDRSHFDKRNPDLSKQYSRGAAEAQGVGPQYRTPVLFESDYDETSYLRIFDNTTVS
jgi:hypothetical protein